MCDLDWDDENYVDPPAVTTNTYYGNSNKRDHKYSNERFSSGYHKSQRTPRDDSGFRNSYDFTESLKIQIENVGRIIGRAGANINRIQSEFNVRVDIDKIGLTVSVQGNLQSGVRDAIDHIRSQVSEEDRTYRSGGRSTQDYVRERKEYREEDRSYHSGGGSTRDNVRERKVYSGGDNGNYRSSGSGGYGQFRNPDNSDDNLVDEQSKGNSNDEGHGAIIDWNAINKRSEAFRAARWAKCPPLTKKFYNEQPEVANLKAEEVERMRAENNNTSASLVFEEQAGEAPKIPNPVWRFDQCFADYPDLLAEIEKQGFKKPSPIQSQAWPILLQGNDMIGIAQTGTGKTLAFLLPAMIHTEYQSIPRGTRGGANVLILAPTRELALQIEMEVNKYSFRNMKAVCVYGGGDRKLQISDVERGAEIIICTPGRLNDLVQAKVINLNSITYIVLDEADRMLDMGFEPQIRKVLYDIRPDRQTVMTSATWPPGVRRLAQSYMENPVQVCVGSLDLAATHSVKQVIEILRDDDEKYNNIKYFVQEMQPEDKIIIFCGRKARADDLSSELTLAGYMTQCIHGNRDQKDREQAIDDIKTGYVKILIATDVASRGLDIEDVTHVINYDFPRNIEEYVHRVGRTGRAGRTGTSVSYITREDWAMAKELIGILEEADQEVPEELRDMARRFGAMKEKRNNEGGGFRRHQPRGRGNSGYRY